MPVETVERAFRFALDTSPHDVEILERHAGAARWAFNFAHARMLQHHTAYDERKLQAATRLSGKSREDILTALNKAERQRLYSQARKAVNAESKAWCADLVVWDEHRRRVVHKGKRRLDPGEIPGEDATDLARRLYARRSELADLQQADPAAYAAERKAELESVRPAVQGMKEDLSARGAYLPGSYDIQGTWRTLRDLPRDEGGSPWWSEVAIGSLLCGFDRAERAWKNWMASATGKRAGRRMGIPHFKKKGRARDSFALANPSRGVIHLDDCRHLRLTGLGTLRLHQSAKKLQRLLRSGQADITSVTISRAGHRWFACVLAKVQQTIPDKPTGRQNTAGLIAIDLGSSPLAVLSAPLTPGDPDGATVDAYKPLNAEQRRLTRAQRALSRTQKGSKRRRVAARRVGRIHAQVVERRASFLHGVSKQLATGAAHIAIEDLDLTALTASARGTVD